MSNNSCSFTFFLSSSLHRGASMSNESCSSSLPVFITSLRCFDVNQLRFFRFLLFFLSLSLHCGASTSNCSCSFASVSSLCFYSSASTSKTSYSFASFFSCCLHCGALTWKTILNKPNSCQSFCIANYSFTNVTIFEFTPSHERPMYQTIIRHTNMIC